jgi:hypothetical protein
MKRLSMFGMMLVMAMFGGACKQEKAADGPAEHAGEKLDTATEKAKHAGKDAVEATKEGADDAKKNVEKKTDKK